MIDLKLLDILQTLCIGVFCLALIIFFYFFYSKCFIKDKFNVEDFFSWLKNDILKSKVLDSGYLAIGVLLVYFLGTLASDLTERMTDSNNDKERSPVLKELNSVSFMPTVGEIRKLALIGSDSSLTTLGNSVFSSGSLVKEANNFNKTNYFLKPDSTLDTKHTDSLVKLYSGDPNFDKFISLLYYTSKNWCYSFDHEPLSELKAIQCRIDLSRSLVLLLSVALQLMICLYTMFIILHFRPILNRRKKANSAFNDLYLSCRNLFLKSIILFLITGILCRECFKIGLLSYNKRAYGYYTTFLANPATYKHDNIGK